jgi:hypothetical protein
LVSVVIPTHNRREKLNRLLRTILQSDYPKDKLEIIVVDDASTDGTYKAVKKEFPEVEIFRNKNKKLVSACRNMGIKNSKGEFIFLVDDDNIIDKLCISEIIRAMNNENQIGIAAPIMFYLEKPKNVWCAGIRHNMQNSRTTYLGNGQTNRGQFKKIVDSDSFPNAFIIRSEIVKSGVLFDEKVFLWMYEESDFCYRAKAKGWRIVLVPTAKIWHDAPFKGLLLHSTELKAYYLARNRILFHKKYSTKNEFLQIEMIAVPTFMVVYIFKFLWEGITSRKLGKAMKVSSAYLRGIIDGVKGVRAWPNVG